MTPQRVANPQTVVGRTVQVGGVGTVSSMPGVNRANTLMPNQLIMSSPGVGGIRLSQPVQISHNTITSATVGQNLVINQPGMRPGQPGSQITVPLQALQSLRPGQGIPTGQGGHLLVKTDSGQFQIMRVGQTITTVNNAVGVGQLPTTPINSMAIRAVSVAQTVPSNNVALVQPQRSIVTTMNHTPSRPVLTTAASSSGLGSPAGAGGGNMNSQMTPDTAKLKCKNFLATLLRLAGEQPVAIANNVRNLIQGLIDGTVEPEVFTNKLQKELNSSPQPCLVPFLKKSLPHLQNSLRNGELSIEGVNAPAGSLMNQHQVQTLQHQGQSVKVQVIGGTGMQLPQQPLIVRTSTPQSVRPVGAMGSVAMSGVQHMRPTTMSQGNVRAGTNQPKTTLGYATVNRSGQQLSQIQLTAGQISKPTVSVATRAPTAQTVVIGSHPKFDRKGTLSGLGDDDINDVASMGGINLAEESQRMQKSEIGSHTRSYKDEAFLQTGLLQQKILKICQRHGLGEPSAEIVNLVSHATQEKLKTLIEKLNVIAEHRLDVIKPDGIYEVSQDVRGQIRFLGELDKIERKRHEEAERELLMKAAKSRTKTEDPEKEKLKAKAKELQRIEEEQLRHEKANNTALMAIGLPKKKMRLDDSTLSTSMTASELGTMASNVGSRPRIKRVQARDLFFLMEQEKDLSKSLRLWKGYTS